MVLNTNNLSAQRQIQKSDMRRIIQTKANRLFLSVKMKNPRKNEGESEWQDSNLRPLRPERSALPSWATLR